jgi:hypothetical protein
MNCANHAEVENIAFCIKCGTPLCAQCARQVQASIYCEKCLADSVSAKTAGPSPEHETARMTGLKAGGASPEAAFILGLIPAVGAIYNAEFFKAAIHVVVFGFLVTLADHARGSADFLLSLVAFGFYAYMPFEAYYTAKKRKLALQGIDLETPFDQLGEQLGEFKNRELWGGIVLVAIGVVFLLDNFNIVAFGEIQKLWPLVPMAVGVLLIRRFAQGKSE